ncbi:4 TM domain-containing transmembrane protein [Acrasis kona]|uniref:4 TM domain-containing transmembrane protein n=1 Tax=Acrasis kona TaxID=1008807 RepID=A0AAW2ZAX9_9EUKA
MSFIVSAHTNQPLELPWAVVDPTSTQPLWDMVEIQHGFHRIVYRASGQDLTAKLTVNNEEILTLEPADMNNRDHHWKIGATGGSTVVLESRSVNKLLQVDDAGVLSLGNAQYMATQYWIIEPIDESSRFIPAQQPLTHITEQPAYIASPQIPVAVGTSSKATRALGITILVVSILMLISNLLALAWDIYIIITNADADIVEQFYPNRDRSTFLYAGTVLQIVNICISCFGIASSSARLSLRVQSILLKLFIIIICVKLAAEVGLTVTELFTSGKFHPLTALINAAAFTVIILIPAISCIACAGARVHYIKKLNEWQRVENEVEMTDV